MSLLSQSNSLVEKGQKLIDQSELYKILQNYGEVRSIGSFKYNLMLSNEIDFYVISPTLEKEDVLKCLLEIINSNFFYGHYYVDNLINYKYIKKDSYYVDGHLITLKARLMDQNTLQKWEIEIWFCKNRPKSESNIDELIKNKLTDDKRELILQLKQRKKEEKLTLASKEIYIAVLENGISTWDELIILSKSKGLI